MSHREKATQRQDCLLDSDSINLKKKDIKTYLNKGMITFLQKYDNIYSIFQNVILHPFNC